MELFIIKTNSVKNGCSFSDEHFPSEPGIKTVIWTQNVRKNLFLSACFCWDSRLSLREMDQKFKFGGTIGYVNSYFEFLFRHFKVFRLHAILDDAAGAVWAHGGKGPGYWYMIGRGPNPCLIGHVTGIPFCLYVKIFPPSIFNSVDFWSSISCSVLDNELPGINIFKELGILTDGKVEGYSFRPPKKYKPAKQSFRCTRNSHGFVCVWNSGFLDSIGFQTFFLEL